MVCSDEMQRDRKETKCLHLYVHLNTLVSMWMVSLIERVCYSYSRITVYHNYSYINSLNSFKLRSA